ncbi:UxaA family hydrolase [Blautia schinkii]|nr:UxaA family hydrolase [Blautia schinkii]
MEDLKLALKVDDKDNVATIFANNIMDNTEVEIRDKKGNTETVHVIGDIPYGHKIAARDIKAQEPIMKYGESIGAAVADIRKGEYVHIHNMVALRGRGDLEGGKA